MLYLNKIGEFSFSFFLLSAVRTNSIFSRKGQRQMNSTNTTVSLIEFYSLRLELQKDSGGKVLFSLRATRFYFKFDQNLI